MSDADPSLLDALRLAARLHGLACDAIPGAEASSALSGVDLVHAAEALGLRVRRVRRRWQDLPATPLPALVHLDARGWTLLVGCHTETVTLLAADAARPTVLGRADFEGGWRGDLLLLAPRAPAAARATDTGWLSQQLRPDLPLLADGLLAAGCLQLLALGPPLAVQAVIDKVLVHQGRASLDALCLGLLVLALLEAATGLLRSMTVSQAMTRAEIRMGKALFTHVLDLPLERFLGTRLGETLARIREMDQVRVFFTGTLPGAILDALFAALFCVALFIYSSALGLIVYASLLLLVLPVLATAAALRNAMAERASRHAECQAFLAEHLREMELLKRETLEPQVARAWATHLTAASLAQRKVQRLTAVATQGVLAIQRLTAAALLWQGAREVMAGAMTVGELVAFNLLAGRLNGPVLNAVQAWQEFVQARLSLQRLASLLRAPPERGLDRPRSGMPAIRGSLRFEAVRFRYHPTGPWVLDALDFQIEAGERVALVGPSGSGKSTVASLLQRFHSPESGRIEIDGLDLEHMNPRALRRALGVVGQESRLLNRSVRENISLRDPGQPLAPIIHAARLAGAHDFILRLGDGYDTLVAEGGTRLSGGQRQRIAMARVLLGEARLLVLDEVSSALDALGEREFEVGLAACARGRTVLLITHRLSLARRMDRILVLERGRIIEAGTHAHLLQRGGLYARLWRAGEGQS